MFRPRYAGWWLLGLVTVGVLLSACGSSNAARKPPDQAVTELVYQDPETFTDGSPIPEGAVVRTLQCGASPVQLQPVPLEGVVIPLAELMAITGLPLNREVFCAGTATVDGVAGAPSEFVNFRCRQRGWREVECFAD